MSRINLQVPVKPHLAKYVHSHLANQDGVLYVDAKSALGVFFYAMVQRGTSKKKTIFVGMQNIVVSVPEQDCRGKLLDGRYEGLHITESNVARINEFLDFVFRKELYSRLDMLRERGEMQRRNGKMKGEVQQFMMKYNIDDADLTLDALVKGYERYRKSGKMLVESVV
jgi:hypothetical protein